MKIVLDVDNKTITVLEGVNLKVLYKFLKKHIDNWEDYKLEQEVKTVDRWNWYYYPTWTTTTNNPTITWQYPDGTISPSIEIPNITSGAYVVDFT